MNFTFHVASDAVSLTCDDCADTVCTIDDDDDLQVIVQMAEDHAADCEARAGGQA